MSRHESKMEGREDLGPKDLGAGKVEDARLRGVLRGHAAMVVAKHKHRTVSMGDAVLTDRAQEEPDELAVSSLCHNEESGAMRGRFQHVRRVALHNPTLDGEIWVVSTLALYQMVEHLLGTHIRIEIGGERTDQARAVGHSHAATTSIRDRVADA